MAGEVDGAGGAGNWWCWIVRPDRGASPAGTLAGTVLRSHPGRDKADAMRHGIARRLRLRFYIGDVYDLSSVEPVCRDVDFVFHAAALKRIASCEFFPVEQPIVKKYRQVPFVHLQRAVDTLFGLAGARASFVVCPEDRPTSVSAILDFVTAFRDLYAIGDIPNITDPLHLVIINVHRASRFSEGFPIRPPVRGNNRGHLFECVRGHGGQTQVFCPTSHPGITRGDHVHRRKVERFTVLHGAAQINIRRLFHKTIVRFEVSGHRPTIVEMPTRWAYSLTNTAASEPITLVWAHEPLEPLRPDTYPELVQPEPCASNSRV